MTETKRRTIRAPETRRAQLLDAAASLLIERGLDAVSVADITTRAGLAKGTFYLYFESRDELLEALRTDVAREGLKLFGALEPPPTPEEWPAFLDTIVDRTFDFFGEHPIHDLLAAQPHHHSETSGDWPVIVSIYARLGQIVAAGIEAGGLAADPDVAPALLFDLLHEAWHLPFRTRDETSAERVRRETKRILRGALLR